MSEGDRRLPGLLARFVERNVPREVHGLGVLLAQEGEMRLAEGKAWVPFTAEQWISAERLEFRWHARVKMAPLVTAVVEDAYENGHGRLDAKVWGVLPVAHARGADIDRGEVQRYLAELPWCPMAIAHNDALRFGEGVHGAVRVSGGGDDQAWVDLRFDDEGDLIGTYTTTRERDGRARPWEGVFAEYATLGGLRIPTRAEVKWHMPDGEHAYFRGRIVHLEVRDTHA